LYYGSQPIFLNWQITLGPFWSNIIVSQTCEV